MSIPITFAFDFEQVMALPESGFVAGNFARTAAAPGSGDAAFGRLDFDLIYHDAPPPRERMEEIHNWRMSEAVVRRALPLDHLSYIVCRTTHEERTLRHMIGGGNLPQTIVEQKGSIFMRRGIFIDEIYWESNMLHMRFHAPTVYSKDQYSIDVTCWEGSAMRTRTYSAAPGFYHFSSMPASKNAVWKIQIEGCIVYHAPIPSKSGLVA